MNHTIKGIILVVITSMLFVGLSMVPIMQNSFARSTNTNSNTNTATSDSDSTATASNTNNITNTATASNSQEQSACAVAVTCPEGTTTVTPPTTGTLRISKNCATGCQGVEFPITVTGNNPQPDAFTLQSGQTQAVTLGPGTFTITESLPGKGFGTPSFVGDCFGPAGQLEATGTISAGQTLHCTIENQPRD